MRRVSLLPRVSKWQEAGMIARTRPGGRLTQIIACPSATASGAYWALGIVAGVLGLGLLAAGLYLAPELATLGLVLLGLGLPIVLLLWHRPEFGLLAVIFLSSSFVPVDIVDLRLPGGGLDLRDLALIGMLGLLVFRGLARESLQIPWWPVSLPLLLFMGFAFFSALYALFFQKVEPNFALSDLRIVLFYAVFLVAAWSITRRPQLVIVVCGLFLIADLVAGTILLQQLLGTDNPLLTAMSSRAWHLWQQAPGSSEFGTLRIIPPGHVLVYIMMIAAFCLMVFAPMTGRLRAISALQFVYLNVGLLLTYTRAQWMAAAIALGLIASILISAYKAQLVRYIIVGVAVLLVTLPVIGKVQSSIEDVPLFNVLTARMLSGTVDDWRLFESEEALRSISQNLILGVGLGNSYRDLTLLGGEAQGWWSAGGLAAGEVSRFTRYIHNSYLAIAVKMGLPALVTFLWFCTAYAVCGWQLYRNLADRQLKGLVLALTTSLLGLMAWAVLHSHFMEAESTSVVGLMAGLLASVHFLQESQAGSPVLQQQPASRLIKSEMSP